MIQATIQIHDQNKTPENYVHIFVTFDNGFQACGYYHQDTNNVRCADGATYLFAGVKSWFCIPKEAY